MYDYTSLRGRARSSPAISTIISRVPLLLPSAGPRRLGNVAGFLPAVPLIYPDKWCQPAFCLGILHNKPGLKQEAADKSFSPEQPQSKQEDDHA
jgi:hypothetical protein